LVISSVRKEHKINEEKVHEKDACVGPSRCQHIEANRAMDFEIFSRVALKSKGG
jgi:hypothetical protein